MVRVPDGQAERSRPFSSQNTAPSRSSPAWVMAGTQALPGIARMASRTGAVRSKPTEKLAERVHEFVGGTAGVGAG